MPKITKVLDRLSLGEELLRNLDDEGCEGRHSGYWDECYMCDHGSLNIAALGTVDFNGKYTSVKETE
jgi:hypothetical protein